MPELNVIGLIGRKTSGKDTLCNFLREEATTTTKFIRMAFADRIKEVCAKMFAFPDTTAFHDQRAKECVHPEYYHKSPRELMQWFGTEVVRAHLGPDFWISRLAMDVENALNTYETYDKVTICVTDVRFLNEAQFLIDKFGAKLVYIDADDRLGPIPDDAHVSEKEIYDVVEKFSDRVVKILNNDTVDEFKKNSHNI